MSDNNFLQTVRAQNTEFLVIAGTMGTALKYDNGLLRIMNDIKATFQN